MRAPRRPLRDLGPLHRLWPIRPGQQLLLQARPCLPEVRRQLPVVIPSTPGLPLFDRTRFSARRRFAASTTSSMRVGTKAPPRVGAAPGGGPPLGPGGASPASSQSKASCVPIGVSVCCLVPARASPWCLVAECSALPCAQQVLWPRLTSAAPSRPVTAPVASSLAGATALPGSALVLSPRPCRIYLGPVLGITGFTVACQLTHRLGPPIRFLFVRSWLWLRLPSDPASRRRPCLRLAVPIPWAAEDFHLRERAHARRTARTPLPRWPALRHSPVGRRYASVADALTWPMH